MAAMERAAVLYHYPCPDGAFAALAAHLYHSALGIPAAFFPNTVYNPLGVKDLATDAFDAFYLLDFTGPEGFLLDLCAKAKRVIVLDHHKTALKMLQKESFKPSNLNYILDLDRSGATISYDYFTEKLRLVKSESVQEEDSEDVKLVASKDLQRIEMLYKYVEDADLWKWALPNSRAFRNGLTDRHIEFNIKINKELFRDLLVLDPAVLIAEGETSLCVKDTLIDEAIKRSFHISVGEGKFGHFLAVRVDGMEENRSELGNRLAKKSLTLGLRPIGAVVYEPEETKEKDLLKVSLRGIGAVDTTEISEAFGGGGHHLASSFMIHKKSFEKWIV